MFIFRFCNNYGSLLYIAFVKQTYAGCITWSEPKESKYSDCMLELKYQLMFVFGIYIL